MRLDKGACHLKVSFIGLGVLLSVNASCRVFTERVLTRERAYRKLLVGLGVLVACYEGLYAPLHSRETAEYSLERVLKWHKMRKTWRTPTPSPFFKHFFKIA